MEKLIYKTGLEIREKLITSSPLRKPEETAKQLEEILLKFAETLNNLSLGGVMGWSSFNNLPENYKQILVKNKNGELETRVFEWKTQVYLSDIRLKPDKFAEWKYFDSCL